jgi:hypothetical protein
MAKYFFEQVHHVPQSSVMRRVPAAPSSDCTLSKGCAVRANPLTGSLVVRFDPCITTVNDVFDALNAHGLLEAEPVAADSAHYADAVAPSIPSASHRQRARQKGARKTARVWGTGTRRCVDLMGTANQLTIA